MKAALKKAFPDVDIELIESDGGAFEVTKDGNPIFSKKQVGRFPEESEIVKALK